MQAACHSSLTAPWLYGTADSLSSCSCEERDFCWPGILELLESGGGEWQIVGSVFYTLLAAEEALCFADVKLWLGCFVSVLFFPSCLESQKTILAGNPQEMGGWRCLTTFGKHVSCVMSALSAGGAYTMSSLTWSVGRQIEWGVVMLIWHTWKCSNNFLESFMIRSSVI